jgi:hypothetical protein
LHTSGDAHDEPEQDPGGAIVTSPEASDPPEEPELLAAAHNPPLQTWPDVVQSSQKSPPLPQVVSMLPAWQLLCESQHPPQFTSEHPLASSPPLEPLSDPPLELREPPDELPPPLLPDPEPLLPPELLLLPPDEGLPP